VPTGLVRADSAGVAEGASAAAQARLASRI